MRTAIEHMNYANDVRTQGTSSTQLTLEDGSTVQLPTKWVVCPACNGQGTHVATGIDCDGLSAESLTEDPEFAEAYLSGDYDETCGTCDGRTTVQVVNEEALSDEQRTQYEAQQREEAEYRALCAFERRMGC